MLYYLYYYTLYFIFNKLWNNINYIIQLIILNMFYKILLFCKILIIINEMKNMHCIFIENKKCFSKKE